jgi:hypothetical protein
MSKFSELLKEYLSTRDDDLNPHLLYSPERQQKMDSLEKQMDDIIEQCMSEHSKNTVT